MERDYQKESKIKGAMLAVGLIALTLSIGLSVSEGLGDAGITGITLGLVAIAHGLSPQSIAYKASENLPMSRSSYFVLVFAVLIPVLYWIFK